MSPNTQPVLHPREIEMAELLKECEFEWKLQTGDWFYANGDRHVVLQIEGSGEDTILHGIHDNTYKMKDVLWLPHRTYCREWLMSHDWELVVDNTDDGQTRARAIKRKTDYTLERTEPTELSAIYALIVEVLEQMHFGWL